MSQDFIGNAQQAQENKANAQNAAVQAMNDAFEEALRQHKAQHSAVLATIEPLLQDMAQNVLSKGGQAEVKDGRVGVNGHLDAYWRELKFHINTSKVKGNSAPWYSLRVHPAGSTVTLEMLRQVNPPDHQLGPHIAKRVVVVNEHLASSIAAFYAEGLQAIAW